MLKVNNIDSYYGQFQVIKSVSLNVNQGELVVLLGPNGHGKSTLCKSICGLIKLRAGSVVFKNKDLRGLTTEKIVEQGLVYISEARNLFPHMTVLKNLKLGAFSRRARDSETENLEWVLSLFPRLEERINQHAITLSGGEARMLALARGLMSKAELLMIDEPSLGLSPLYRMEVFKVIKDIKANGLTIVLVDQHIPSVSGLADHIYLMEEGQITFSGTQEEADNNPDLKEAFLGM